MAEEGQGQEKWACGVAGGQKTARELYSLAGSRGCITDIRNTLARERGTGITAKLGGGSFLRTKDAGRSGGCRTGLAHSHGMVAS